MLHAQLKAIRRANHYIYIEDQYFWVVPELQAALLEALDVVDFVILIIQGSVIAFLEQLDPTPAWLELEDPCDCMHLGCSLLPLPLMNSIPPLKAHRNCLGLTRSKKRFGQHSSAIQTQPPSCVGIPEAIRYTFIPKPL